MTRSEKQYYTKVMGEVKGPFTSTQLKQLAQSGRLFPESLIRSSTTGDWVSADRVKGLSFTAMSASPNPTKSPPIQELPALKPTRGNRMLYVAIGCGIASSFAVLIAVASYIFHSDAFVASLRTIDRNESNSGIGDVGGQSHKESVPPLRSSTAPEITKVMFDIKGMRIGDPLTDDFVYNYCQDKDKGKPDITGSEIIELNGSTIYVFYQFDNFKLVGVMLSFKSVDFDTVLSAYKQKFGVPPHSVRTETVKTPLNAEFENVIATWETTSGPFVVRKYASKITDGYATLNSPAYDAYLARQRQERVEELGNNL